MLGVMNLLPFQHLMEVMLCFIVRKLSAVKPSDVLENAQMVGFVILISLLLFANGKRYLLKAIVGK
jgi:regulator of sigma E protease